MGSDTFRIPDEVRIEVGGTIDCAFLRGGHGEATPLPEAALGGWRAWDGVNTDGDRPYETATISWGQPSELQA